MVGYLCLLLLQDLEILSQIKPRFFQMFEIFSRQSLKYLFGLMINFSPDPQTILIFNLEAHQQGVLVSFVHFIV